jgi:hypothetical protein
MLFFELRHIPPTVEVATLSSAAQIAIAASAVITPECAGRIGHESRMLLERSAPGAACLRPFGPRQWVKPE